MSQEPALSLKRVFQHVNNRAVLQDIDLQLEHGKCLLILGRNGSGKSLLMRLLLGLDAPSSGELLVLGHKLSGDLETDWSAFRRGVGSIFQGGSLLGDLTVMENMLLSLRSDGLSGEDQARRVRLMLTRLHLDGIENLLPDELSGGLQRQVELARALIHKPRLLIWDEVSDGLDWSVNLQVLDLLRAEVELRGMTVVLTSRVETPVAELASHVAVLDSGRMVYQGEADSFDTVRRNRSDIRHILESRV